MINLQDYILHSGHFNTLKVDDLLFVEYRCLINDKESEIWSHTNYLAYVLGGKKTWKTPSNEIKVSSGEALFIKKGANTVYQYFEEPFLVLFIFLREDFIKSVINKYQQLGMPNSHQEKQDQLIKLKMNSVLNSLFQSILAYFSKDAQISENILKLKMEELILSILTQPGNNELKQYFYQLLQYRKSDIREIMNNNFSSPLSIDDFARLSARSLSTFRRDFKDAFNAPPGKWLVNKRLDYSKFLLETTDHSLIEIMEQSGFKNRSHFVKAFKQTFNTSPSRYRSKKIEV